MSQRAEFVQHLGLVALYALLDNNVGTLQTIVPTAIFMRRWMIDLLSTMASPTSII
jgi:hypothetical protein